MRPCNAAAAAEEAAAAAAAARTALTFVLRIEQVVQLGLVAGQQGAHLLLLGQDLLIFDAQPGGTLCCHCQTVALLQPCELCPCYNVGPGSKPSTQSGYYGCIRECSGSSVWPGAKG